MIVTDLALTNIIYNLLQDRSILLIQTIIQHPLVALINLTLVLANAFPVITTPLLDAINHHIVLLLNHVMTATAVVTSNQNHTQITNTNPMLDLVSNPLH